ncbi:DUF397 domain-containing protein [Spirillospora sp. NPDC050679]
MRRPANPSAHCTSTPSTPSAWSTCVTTASSTGSINESSHSTKGGGCVQVNSAEAVYLRDSRDAQGPMLSLSRGAWASLAASLKRGAHDL